MSTAPYPKWVYDIVMELQHCKNNGLAADLNTLLGAVPSGMRLVTQGILDYHHLMNEIAPPAPTAPAPAPAPDNPPAAGPDAVWPPVISLQQAGANGQLSQAAQ